MTHSLLHIIYATLSDKTMESSNLPDIWRVNLNPRKVSKDNYDPSKEVFNWEFVGFMPYEVFFHSSAYDENRIGLYLRSRIWYGAYDMNHMIYSIWYGPHGTHDMAHMIWIISYESYDMIHMIRAISYGLYYMVYIAHMIWFTVSDKNSAFKVKKYLYLGEMSWKKIIPNEQISFLLSVSHDF